MTIATYSIWNSDVGMPLRSNQIFKEIVHLNADIVCLLIYPQQVDTIIMESMLDIRL